MKLMRILCSLWIALAGVDAAGASGEAELMKKHYPHGIHKLKTDKASDSITWASETLDNDSVKRETLNFVTLDEFKVAFLKARLHKAAYIEIAGVWEQSVFAKTNPRQNEALLGFIRANGYEESGYASLKKYYRPSGHHFVDAIRSEGTVLWSSSQIKGDRIIKQKREFASVEEFKKAFSDAGIDKQAEIDVHVRAVKFEGATARTNAILEYLKAEGYKSVGGVSN